MGVGSLIGFFILVFLVIIFFWLLIRTVKRKSKVGIIVYGIILVALLSIFFTNNIDGILTTKQDVKNDLKHFNISLKDDFEIENNSISGMPERNQETKLKISEKDALNVLNEIKNAKNFVEFKNDEEMMNNSTSENVNENGEILNFKYPTFYSRELYKTIDNISTRLFLNIKENENILEYQKFEWKNIETWIKTLLPTPYIIYAQIGFSRNWQTFNKNIATAEKSPIFKPHKLYTNSLAYIIKKIRERVFTSDKR